MKFDLGNFTFDSTFDSGNLGRVELVKSTADGEYIVLVWLLIVTSYGLLKDGPVIGSDAIWNLSSELSIPQLFLSFTTPI